MRYIYITNDRTGPSDALAESVNGALSSGMVPSPPVARRVERPRLAFKHHPKCLTTWVLDCASRCLHLQTVCFAFTVAGLLVRCSASGSALSLHLIPQEAKVNRMTFVRSQLLRDVNHASWLRPRCKQVVQGLPCVQAPRRLPM